MLSFGSWIFSTALIFGADHLDGLIFGKLTIMATPRIYRIAAMLATTLSRRGGLCLGLRRQSAWF